MKAYPNVRRWLAGLTTLLVLGAALTWTTLANRYREDFKSASEQASVQARTWPLFGGTLSRNMVNTIDKNLPIEWATDEGQEKNILWSTDLGSKAYGGPVIADGKVFIGTNNEKPRDPKIKGDKGVLMCFNQADGKFLWQQAHDKLKAGRVNDWPQEGICSTPVVEGKRLYYVSNRAEVICSDTDGKIQWKFDMIGKLDVFPHNLATCSPLIAGDLLFVITSNGVDEGHINLPEPKAPSFIVLDKKTGKLEWQDNSPSIKLVELQKGNNSVDIKALLNKGEIIMHGQWSNPVYTEANGKPQIIFPGGDGRLRSFEPKTGKLIWTFDCNPKDSIYKLGPAGTRNDFLATPVVYDKRVYIGVGQDPEHKEGVGHLWCIDITKEGDVSPVNDNFDPKAPENAKSALVWHFGGPADPKKIGRSYYFGRTMSTCAIKDDLVYAVDLGGYVVCLDAKTGKKYWDHDMKSQTWCSPYWVDGKIYMGNDDGLVHIFAHGKEKKLLGQVQMEGNVRATPVAANGVLYVMIENKVFAIGARGQ